MREPVELPQMPAPAEQSWIGLLDVADAVPDRWALVGGQLVHLHCWERGAMPQRATRDSDVVLDVRAWPQAAQEFTSTLKELGFVPAGTTWNNRQYRWVRDQAQIDVLIARFLGERAQNRVGVGGGTLLTTPGATSALSRVQAVRVHLRNRRATIRRPSLLGSLIIKATAYVEVLEDPQRDRHLSDFALLVSMVSRSDLAAMVLTRHETRDTRHETREPAAGFGDHPPPWTASARGGRPGCARGTGTTDAGHGARPPDISLITFTPVGPLGQSSAMGSNEPVGIRAAHLQDAHAVAVFQTAVWREAYAGSVPQDYLDRVGVEERLQRWAGRFATCSRQVAVAETGGEVVGVVSWAPSEGEGVPPVELESLYVGAAHRRTGLATRLLHAAVAEEPAFLWVFVDNPRAQASYARHGFVPHGRRAVDPGTGVLEQRMVRR